MGQDTLASAGSEVGFAAPFLAEGEPYWAFQQANVENRISFEDSSGRMIEELTMPTILLLENDEEVGRTYEASLVDAGYVVEWALNIPSAIGMLVEERIEFGLALVDVMMPAEGQWTVDETDEGLQTGLLFFHGFLAPRRIPTIFYTAVPGPYLAECAALLESHRNVVVGVLPKAQNTAEDLVSEVEEFFRRGGQDHDR